MRHHWVFSDSQVKSFDTAWYGFKWLSISIFSLIIAAPMIKAALFITPSAWIAVPGYLAVSGACFWLVTSIADSLRCSGYAPWHRVLLLYGWWEAPQSIIDERLIEKKTKKAISSDLMALEKAAPSLAPKISQFRSSAQALRRRDIRALYLEMERHELRCDTWGIKLFILTRAARGVYRKSQRSF
jgi:hypothetical protein